MEIVNLILCDEIENYKKTIEPERGDSASALHSFIDQTVPPLKDMLNYCHTFKRGDTVEFEARLGRFDATKSRFIPGVTHDFMNECIGRFESWNGWYSVEDWKETCDTFFTTDSGAKVRTTSDFSPVKRSGHPHITHIEKRKIAQADFVTESDTYDENTYDVRVALNKEVSRNVDGYPHVKPDFVRLKQRKSFLYKPEGADEPYWRFDFTLSWEGETAIECDMNQDAGLKTRYEIEVECTNPHHYIKEKEKEYVAASLLLKVRKNVMNAADYQNINFRLVQSKRFA